jgi:DNA-binding NarL/FixJ family response regulator
MRWKPFPTVLAGPSALIREGMTRILSPKRFRIITSAACVDDLLLNLPSEEGSLLLIIDSGDDLVASTEQIRLFKKRYSVGRIAVLADHDESNDVVSAYLAGANAYLVKTAACDVLIKSLELVILGETILPPAILSSSAGGRDLDKTEAGELDVASSKGLSAAPTALMPTLSARGKQAPQVRSLALTDREKQVLGLLGVGTANKLIARQLGLTESTVKVHVRHIMRKLGATNRTQAALCLNSITMTM